MLSPNHLESNSVSIFDQVIEVTPEFWYLQAKPNVPRPNQRKKWRKSVLQLVPVAPQQETTGAPRKAESTDIPRKPDNSTSEADIPPKLPRAMRLASSTGANLLRERNADQAEESVNKDSGVHPPSSPALPARTSDEKENRRQWRDSHFSPWWHH